jgi:cytidylate kinase
VAVAAAVHKPALCSGTDPADPGITVDGVDVSGSIRSREVTSAVSAVSAVPAVRTRLVAMQQAIIARCSADDGGIVVEGRDIGTVVAPDAPVKMYLTASEEARAGRRNAETTVETVPVEVTRDEIARRDRLDSTRAVAPLARAADAIELDTTALTQQQVVDVVLARVRRVVQPVSGDFAH